MSIAEKLTTIAENTPKVYEAGLGQGEENIKTQFWKDILRWDGVSESGQPTNLNNAFSGVYWTKDTFKPPCRIVPNSEPSSARGMFAYFNLGETKRDNMVSITYDMLDLSNCKTNTSVYGMFENATFESIEVDLSGVPQLYNTFSCNNGGKIYKIRTKINATTFSNCFNNASMLEELILEEGSGIGGNGFNVQWSTKLNKASFISIYNALSPNTTGLSITVSKTAINNAFGINVDNETTYPVGSEYYNLRHSKDNWTINYI